MLLAKSASCIPGSGIQFLIEKTDTFGIVIGTDTFGLLSILQVEKVNDVKIFFDQCRERNDSLRSIIRTLQNLNLKNENIIHFQSGENRLLLQAADQDQIKITGLEKAVERERKKSIPWKLSTFGMLIIGLIKYF